MFAENRQNVPGNQGDMGREDRGRTTTPGDMERDKNKTHEPGRTNPERQGQSDIGTEGK